MFECLTGGWAAAGPRRACPLDGSAQVACIFLVRVTPVAPVLRLTSCTSSSNISRSVWPQPLRPLHVAAAGLQSLPTSPPKLLPLPVLSHPLTTCKPLQPSTTPPATPTHTHTQGGRVAGRQGGDQQGLEPRVCAPLHPARPIQEGSVLAQGLLRQPSHDPQGGGSRVWAGHSHLWMMVRETSHVRAQHVQPNISPLTGLRKAGL